MQLLKITTRYDEDIARLRHEIEARGGPPSHVGVSGLPPHGGVSQPAPPAIGHGPSNLFGGIMANPPGQGNPGLVPPSQDQQQQQQQQGPPPHQMPQPQQGLQSGLYQGSYPQPPVVNGKTQHFMELDTCCLHSTLMCVYRLRIASADCFPRSWQATQQPRTLGSHKYSAAIPTYVLSGSFPSNGEAKPTSAVPQRREHARRPGS